MQPPPPPTRTQNTHVLYVEADSSSVHPPINQHTRTDGRVRLTRGEKARRGTELHRQRWSAGRNRESFYKLGIHPFSDFTTVRTYTTNRSVEGLDETRVKLLLARKALTLCRHL